MNMFNFQNNINEGEEWVDDSLSMDDSIETNPDNIEDTAFMNIINSRILTEGIGSLSEEEVKWLKMAQWAKPEKQYGLIKVTSLGALVKYINNAISLGITIKSDSRLNWNNRYFGNTGDYNWLDVSSITSFLQLFKDKKEFNGDISKWDVSHVNIMIKTFEGCTNFKTDISQWNLASIKFATACVKDSNEILAMQMQELLKDKPNLQSVANI